MFLKSELPYSSDVQRLFGTIASRPWSMWLDSCTLGGELGRFDILVTDPHTTLVTRGDKTLITSPDGEFSSTDDPFRLLSRVLELNPQLERDADIPFAGGAVGYFAYDLARRIESLPELAEADIDMPEMAVGIYDWAVVCDHHVKRCWLVSYGREAKTSDQWPELLALFQQSSEVQLNDILHSTESITANMDEERYASAFERIQHYLVEGDCYQVNFAQRFTANVTGDSFQGYLKLREQNPAPFAAYLNTPYGQVLSTSPERFLQLKDGEVETRPIKGTRPRAADAATDHALKLELQQSEKDRAENLMIVDLLRNDLSRNCRSGSVKVPQLFAVESYATVHHLVSVIQGQLRSDSDALKLLRDSFPGGSITGAPKLRAMEVIEELEPCRRSIYCGSIGYIGFNGDMDTSIVIRTAIHRDGKLYYSAGGGIVRDSECSAEYQETFDKAASFFRCFSKT